MENNGILQVAMFHNCSITRRLDNQKWFISDQDQSSKKMWLLLEYLLWNHSKPIPRDALLDLLWGDEKTSNPANSLKSLLFRVRNLLGPEGLGFENPKQIILYQNGNYLWNQGIHIELDTELFEKHVNDAESMMDNPDASLTSMLEALSLYKGDFLSQNEGNSWLTPLSVYFHAQFLKLCNTAIDLLRREDRHGEIIRLAHQAISLEPYDEALHRALIRALAATGASNSALQHYEYTTELFMNQFGVSPSSEMTDLYRELSKSLQGTEHNLQIVRDDLQESELSNGPYFCGYATFKEIYHLSARSASRSGEVVQLVMLTVQALGSQPLLQKQAKAAMMQVHAVISSTLRMGDIITQYSPTQYLVMLPSASFENAKKVMVRLMQNFLSMHPKVRYSIHYSLLPLMPVMQNSPAP